MFRLILIILFWGVLGATSAALAQSKGKQYGIGYPHTVDELPNGKLKRQIQGLPIKARGKALGWLQSFSFPTEDVQQLTVSPDGSVAYIETNQIIEPSSLETSAPMEALSLTETFKLHSKPGAQNVVYLDFDGHIIENNAWNNYMDEPLYEALPFDPSGNDTTSTEAEFTSDELARIHEIWHRISEDYAAFDIDVTTELPDEFTNTTGRVLITQSVDANGLSMPGGYAGGIAFVNVFGNNRYSSYYNIALVFYQNLGSGVASAVAEACSHEFGHHLGLGHDGVEGGSSYYRGHGSGETSWAPIMGSAYTKNVSSWSSGEYANANNDQDDIAIIANKLNYASDDHGNAEYEATALYIESDGRVLVSNPQDDPNNSNSYNKGIINHRDDADWFSMDLGEGNINLTLTPAWHAFTRSSNKGANLDIKVTLYSNNLNAIKIVDSISETKALLQASVTAGRYYLKIEGVGSDNYSDYASMGMYFIEGTVVPGDSLPPPPPANVEPTASFFDLCEDLGCSFDASASSDSDGEIVNYQWSISDGASGAGVQFTHNFSNEGTYSVKLTVTDDDGATHSTQQIIAVTEPPPPTDNEAPTVNITSPSDGAVIEGGSRLTLQASATDNDSVSFVRFYVDGSLLCTDSSENYSCSWRMPKAKGNSYLIQAVATDVSGNSSSDAINITSASSKGSGNGGGNDKPCRGKKCQ